MNEQIKLIGLGTKKGMCIKVPLGCKMPHKFPEGFIAPNGTQYIKLQDIDGNDMQLHEDLVDTILVDLNLGHEFEKFKASISELSDDYYDLNDVDLNNEHDLKRLFVCTKAGLLLFMDEYVKLSGYLTYNHLLGLLNAIKASDKEEMYVVENGIFLAQKDYELHSRFLKYIRKRRDFKMTKEEAVALKRIENGVKRLLQDERYQDCEILNTTNSTGER